MAPTGALALPPTVRRAATPSPPALPHVQVVDEYRAALGLYHRTVTGFQQLRFEVAQCCAQELGLVVELQLPPPS